jgi:hypothetical protein
MRQSLKKKNEEEIETIQRQVSESANAAANQVKP